MDALSPETIQSVVDMLTTYGLRVAGGIVILIIGWWLAGQVSNAVRKVLSRRSDQTLAGFVASLVRYLVIAFVVIAVLNQFGVQTASLIAVLGAAGLAIGLALQGTLSSVAAGVLLLAFRPFRVGQYVEVGSHAGTVKALTLFTTELATPDNVQIILPNAQVWGEPIVNYSHHSQRRVDFTLGIAYGDDIGRAMDIVRKVIDADERTLKDPEPQIVVGALGASSVDIIVRVWANSGDYWPLKFDLTRDFKEAFDDGGISIPFPQSEVHLSDHALKALRGAA